MRARHAVILAGLTIVALDVAPPSRGLLRAAVAQQAQRLNPIIDLLANNKPVFGLYAPANPGGRGRGAPVDSSTLKTPAQLAADAIAHAPVDYIFDGTMEGAQRFDASYTRFAEFAKGFAGADAFETGNARRLRRPLFVKTPIIGANRDTARARIARQLNLGVSGIVFTGVESADELKEGLAMMRFKSQGGTRADDIGGAAAAWGMSEKDYRARADLWPLNSKGELVNFTIVESKEGLAHIREIAAVKGIGVLFPGAGTLRGVFSTRDSVSGQMVRDTVAWEGAIQQVLAACKEFKVACGYPAGPNDIEMRMKQGFSVFVINWGDAGFRAVDLGMAASGRASAK